MARSMNVGDYDLGISTENDIDDVSGESEFPQEGIQINETTDDDSLETIENKEQIPKDAFSKHGIVLKEDLYKLIESSVDGNMIVYTVPIE